MRMLIEESSIMSRKAFLRSFVERIEVDDSYAKVIYTLPPDDPPTETVGVLPIVHDGPPKKIIPHQGLEAFFELSVTSNAGLVTQLDQHSST